MCLFFISSCGGSDNESSGTPTGEVPDRTGNDGFPSVPDRWTQIDANPEGLAKLYIAIDTIKEDETTGYITSWILLVATEAASRQQGVFPVVWVELLERTDCENNQKAVLTFVNRDKFGLIVSKGSNPFPTWEPVIPGTLSESHLDYVCDR